MKKVVGVLGACVLSLSILPMDSLAKIQYIQGYTVETESWSSRETIRQTDKGLQYSLREENNLSHAFDDFYMYSDRKVLPKQPLNIGIAGLSVNKGYATTSTSPVKKVNYSDTVTGIKGLTIKKGKFYYFDDLYTGDITRALTKKDNKTYKLILYKGMVYGNFITDLSVKETLLSKTGRTTSKPNDSRITWSAKTGKPLTPVLDREYYVLSDDNFYDIKNTVTEDSFYMGDLAVSIKNGYIVNEKGSKLNLTDKMLGIPLLTTKKGLVYDGDSVHTGRVRTVITNKHGVQYSAILFIYKGKVLSIRTVLI